MNNTKLTFLLGSTNPEVPLCFETWIDDQLVYQNFHVPDSVEVSVDLPEDDAEHVLKFVMAGKRAEHTQIDREGKIIGDARIKLARLAFDDVELGHSITTLAVYEHDSNGNDKLEKHTFYGEMGCNGTITLEFFSPVYLWLLENM